MSTHTSEPKCDRCQTPMERYAVPGTGGKEQSWRLACPCQHSATPDVARTSNDVVERISEHSDADACQRTLDLLNDAAADIKRLQEVIARCYMRLQCADVPREPWHWEVCTTLNNTGIPAKPSEQCPYCLHPVRIDGSILHAGGCAGLDTIKVTRLQYDTLTKAHGNETCEQLMSGLTESQREQATESLITIINVSSALEKKTPKELVDLVLGELAAMEVTSVQELLIEELCTRVHPNWCNEDGGKPNELKALLVGGDKS